ncbi:MAG: hypothetical protein NZM11_13610 [Anaerolineales bacterium]|nr:hypothetical protein [Anaerolineales bacterium]MDW8325474.1 hypothetical protein [Anaerolineales bacterium]
MRQALLGCAVVVGLLVTMGAALLAGQTLGRYRQAEGKPAWVLRLPAQLTPDGKGAVFLISVRDACAFVSLGDFRRELSDRLLGAPPRRNACTPFFPKGSVRR